MVAKLSVVALAALFCFTPSANGQDCVASAVENLRINASAHLSWEIAEDESCEIREFQVDVEGEQEYEMHFRVRFTYVDLSFLPICDEWQFAVTPITTDDVWGFERRLVGHIPLPPTADISLSYFNVTHVTNTDVFLEWDLLNHTHGDCTLRYRIVIEDKDAGEVQDIYVTGLSTSLPLSPCVSYHLTIRAVNIAHPTIEGPMRFHDVEIPPHPQGVPTLTSVTPGVTTMDLTFQVETYTNRCPIRTLYVDGGNQFNISIPVPESLERPPVEVNLKGLQANSMYFLKVSVENSGGISPPAQLAVQTLELNPGIE